MENKIVGDFSNNTQLIHVGVLIDSPDGYFNRRVIIDLLGAAKERNIKLVFFFGGIIGKDYNEKGSSFVFSLPKPSYIDAIILFPHSIAPFNPSDISKLLLQKFPTIPAYSFFGHLPELYSVCSKEDSAIKQLVEHLVVDHKYTKISLLCGHDASNSKSRKRQTLIEKELLEYKISIPEDHIFKGSFRLEDGKKTALSILTNTNNPPEVLICMNDQMALGAVQEFLNHGITVPSDIAIVGFDDVEENSAFSVSFTSINPQSWKMACTILDKIVSDSKISTNYSAEKVVFDATFMQRESCGCISWLDKTNSISEAIKVPEQARASHGNLKQISLLRRNLEKILEESILNSDPSLFTSFVHSALISLSRSGDLTQSFMDSFSTQWTLSLLKHTSIDEQVYINSLFIDAFRQFFTIKAKSFAFTTERNNGTMAFYQSTNELLAKKKSISEAILHIKDNLSLLGIEKASIVFIDSSNENMEELKLSFHHGKESYIPSNNNALQPLTTQLQSDQNETKGPVAILGISNLDTVYGYIIISISEYYFSHFTLIEQLISRVIDSAFKDEKISNRIQLLTQKNEVLAQLSTKDEFTGLYNRRALYFKGKNLYTRATDKGESSCFVFLDMDGLKIINDTWGHKDGDEAIYAFAQVLKKSFRDSDLIARYGGDEFVVLMTSIKKHAVDLALSRIKTNIETFNSQNQKPWKLSASWGFFFTEPNEEPLSFEAIIEESDARLYEEKRKNKARL